MTDPLGPGHLRDMNEPFDPFLQRHEGAILGEAYHLAADFRAYRELSFHVEPGIGKRLLEPQGDLPLVAVILQDHDLELVPHLDRLGRVPQTPPGHVGDMEQTVDTPQVEERAVVGDVLDHPFDDLPLGKDSQRLVALRLPLFLHEDPPGENHIAPLLVQLEDLERIGLPQILVEIGRRTEIHLGGRQEGRKTDIHRHAPLDLGHDLAFDGAAFAAGLGDLFPDYLPLGFSPGKNQKPFFVFAPLQKDADLIPHLNRQVPLLVHELGGVDPSLRFMSDVDQDGFLVDLDHYAFDEFARLELPETFVEHLFELTCTAHRFFFVHLLRRDGVIRQSHVVLLHCHRTPCRFICFFVLRCSGAGQARPASECPDAQTVATQPAPGTSVMLVCSICCSTSSMSHLGVDAPAVTPTVSTPSNQWGLSCWAVSM